MTKMQELSELQRAGVALKTLRGRLQEVEGRIHEPIAVIGLGCRFPGGAGTPDALWSLLERGEDAVREMPAGRWNKDAVYDPRPGTLGKIYTLDAGWLDDVDRFDAAFFGIAPKEAVSMDPQHRILLETAWEALEEAGESVDRLAGAKVGVFLGVTSMDYAQQTIQAGRPELLNGFYTTGVTFNGAAGRLAYTFGFTGPCLAVDTACSSSLVALHLAVRSLRGGECEMALAAGVNVNLFVGNSVSMCEARLISPTGRCRTFDASADGMVRGEGCGVVALKRLSDAVRDGNHIHAVIRGTAVNQDGASSSLSAPNGRAQEAVIRAALADARVKSHEVAYVEAHGSATPLGDPIELRALSAVYGSARPSGDPLLVGSVKAHLGHLESAAGMAGLFKVIGGLAHGRLVKQLHFSKPNPEVDWEHANVAVCAEERAWPRTEQARFAGLSGFGVSGTNAHVILEEAPLPVAGNSGRKEHVLALSAHTPSALEAVTRRVLEHLESHPDEPFADVAHTLQVGRAPHAFRRAAVCSGREDAIRVLSDLDPARVVTRQVAKGRQRPLIFAFPGTGEHYQNMGRGLYEQEPVFRAELLRSAALLRDEIGCDLLDLLYGSPEGRPSGGSVDFASMARGEPALHGPLSRTLYAHVAVFAVEHALGRLLMAWGLEPQLLIGYSTGEYVAACLASVLSHDDALRVLARRAELIEQQPRGAMLSVLAGERDLRAYLNDGLWLAASNGPELSVLAGEEARVSRAEQELQAAGIACRRVGVQHAFHTPLIAGIERPFLELLRGVELGCPRIPIISNVTGERLTDAEARDPGYWFRHAVSPVRFAAGVQAAWSRPERVLLEVGPGQGLSSLALAQGEPGEARVALGTLPSRYEPHGDVAFLQGSLGKLWLNGVPVAWASLYSGQARRKLSLPTYPYERERFWIEAEQGVFAASSPPTEDFRTKPPLERWFHVPEWRRSTLHSGAATKQHNFPAGPWLLFGDARGLGDRLEHALVAAGSHVVRVATQSGASFVTSGNAVVVDPAQPEHLGLLLHHLRARAVAVRNVVYLTSAEPLDGAPSLTTASLAHERGFYTLIGLLQAFGETPLEDGLSLAAVSAGAECVLGDDLTRPEQAVLDGLLRVAQQELAGLRCAVIDLPGAVQDELSERRHAAQILAEFSAGFPEAKVAYRGASRWVRDFREVRLEPPLPQALPLRSGSVCVLTGGLGGIGRTVAAHLAARFAPKLVFITRTPAPPEAEWSEVIARGEGDPNYEKVCLLRSLADAGVESICLSADVADAAALEVALEAARARFGPLQAIFHCAGVPGAGLILTKRRETCEAVFAPKVAGALNLAALCKHDPLEAVVYFSSVTALHGAIGQADYAAANAFLDSFAQYQRQSGVPALSIDWGAWQFDAWQDRLTAALPEVQAYLRERRERLGITLEEGMDALERALAIDAPQLVVSPVPPAELVREHAELELASIKREPATGTHARPSSLLSEYVAPTTDTERALAEIWGQALGVDPVGIVDDFFELGGHSLLGMRVLAEVARRFETVLPLRVLFAEPTIERLAAALEEQILLDIAELPDDATLDAPPESSETLRVEAQPAEEGLSCSPVKPAAGSGPART